MKIQEEYTFEGLKIQFNILYDKVMKHSNKLNDYLNEFEDCILSNLILKIYYINKRYLNINVLIEKLNNYCKRNIIKKDLYSDLEWASFLSRTRNPFDEIIFPVFTPESIIKLFLLKNEKGEDLDGMYSINILNKNKPEFLYQINKLLFEKNIIRF